MAYQISKERQQAALKANEKKKVEKKQEDTKMEIDEPIDQNDPYAKIKISSVSDEDIQCDICLEFDHEDDDQIVICELCNAATHQTCYGGNIHNKLPKGDWYCDRCTVLV